MSEQKIESTTAYEELTVILRDRSGAEINFDLDECTISHSIDASTHCLCIRWQRDELYFALSEDEMRRMEKKATRAKVTIVNVVMDEVFADSKQEEGTEGKEKES